MFALFLSFWFFLVMHGSCPKCYKSEHRVTCELRPRGHLGASEGLCNQTLGTVSRTSLSHSVLLLVCLHLLLPPVFFLTLRPELFSLSAIYSWFLSCSFGAHLTSMTPVAWLYLMTFQLQLPLAPSSLLISQFRSQRVWIYVGRAFWPSSLMDQWPVCGPDTQILAPP